MSNIKMKKLASIKGVIDNLRQSVGSPPACGSGQGAFGPVKLEQDIIENLVPDRFAAEPTLRHGFPFKPLSMAFDPLQKLLAIGNRSGTVRIYGKPGIDAEFSHQGQVLQVFFVVNAGKIVTACTDDTINLWDFRKKPPELEQSLKMSRERLTTIHLEFQDKWLYVGTERGNVHAMNVETFALSGYQISWNKLMDPMQKTHPGAISHISVNPTDPGKLLVGFETGLVCLWDLVAKKGEQRFVNGQRFGSISWHLEGRQFVCGCGDGSLVTWNVKPQNNKPTSVVYPHAKTDKDTGKMEKCDPIDKVVWRVNRSSYEPYFVFSGGLPSDVTGVTPSITFLQGKNATVMEMEYCVLDFLLVTDSPYPSDYQEPESVIAMLTNDLVAIDCKAEGLPCFKNPYAMDFNESPVTCCSYLVDCPGDLIPALYLVGSKIKEGSSRDFSEGEWPVNGGLDNGTESCSYAELAITGHADGCVRFWDASSTTMQSLYRVKTSKFLERTGKSNLEGLEDDPYAVTQIAMCADSRMMAVAGASSHVIFFKFKKKETQTEAKSMEIPIIYEVLNNVGCTSPFQHEFSPRPPFNQAASSSSHADPGEGFNFDRVQYEYSNPFKVRTGAQRKTAGFHAELVCLTPWVNNEPPSGINCLALNSCYGLMAYGNNSGLVIVDVEQNVCLLNMGTADLYGSLDPFQRMPRSPKLLNSSPCDDIVRVDLSNYSQVQTPGPAPNADNGKQLDVPSTPRELARVKTAECKRLQKSVSSVEEASVSKSQSSSVNSLDQAVSSEGVCSVSFVDTFAVKNDFNLNACLVVGTSLGSVMLVTVNLPDGGDPRMTEPVVVSPSGTLFRARGPLLTSCFFDTSLSMLSVRGGEQPENVMVPPRPQEHASATPPQGDRQVLVLCTEKSAAVYGLPSQRQMHCQTLSESANAVTASVVNFGGVRYTPCLVCYTSDGFVKAYCVPSLRPMLDVHFVAMSSPRIGRTMNFSNYGHGLYFANPTEVQKFSISSEFLRLLPDMTGQVFVDGVPTPEPPKQGFLRGLFGGGPKLLDREELFGESAGKASSGVARHVPGAGGMVGLQSKGVGVSSEVSKAKMAMIERGQKLNEVEDRTEAMANEAKQYATNAHSLMLNYKNKKWYQL